jgi:hypothetical protein
VKEEKMKKLGCLKVGGVKNMCLGKIHNNKNVISKMTETPRIWTAYILLISGVFSDFSGDNF